MLYAVVLSALASGCHSVGQYDPIRLGSLSPDSGVPRELEKMTLPTYLIEPPDILLVDAVKVVPKAPYRIEPLDVLSVQASGTLDDAPIAETYSVESSGVINLGPAYGSVAVVGLTLEEATEAIRVHLETILRSPDVGVSLVQSAGEQQIVGEHLVGPDGTVNLGTYGTVYVANMSVAEAKAAIEEHLSEDLEDPEVSIDIFAYNSKVYYVIAEGSGSGDQVSRFPITGNETVLDAVSQLGGLNPNSSNRMWIARPAPHQAGYEQILPVNWQDIVQGGSTTTNYQLLPGDRLFVSEDKVQALAIMVQTLTAPIEAPPRSKQRSARHCWASKPFSPSTDYPPAKATEAAKACFSSTSTNQPTAQMV